MWEDLKSLSNAKVTKGIATRSKDATYDISQTSNFGCPVSGSILECRRSHHDLPAGTGKSILMEFWTSKNGAQSAVCIFTAQLAKGLKT